MSSLSRTQILELIFGLIIVVSVIGVVTWAYASHQKLRRQRLRLATRAENGSTNTAFALARVHEELWEGSPKRPDRCARFKIRRKPLPGKDVEPTPRAT